MRQSASLCALYLSFAALSCGCGASGAGKDAIAAVNDQAAAELPELPLNDSSRDSALEADTTRSSDAVTDTEEELRYFGGASCTNADQLLLDAAQITLGVIDPPGDKDYYRLSLEAGQFVQITTVSSTVGGVAWLDTVLTLYSGDGKTLLASADDRIPELSQDAELFYRSPETADYCLRIEDFSTWRGLGAKGGHSYVYTVQASLLSPAQPGFAFSQEPDTHPTEADATAFLEAAQGWRAVLLGVLEPADIDRFSFVQNAASRQLLVFPLPGGTGAAGAGAWSGDGSTLEPGRLILTDNLGARLAAISLDLGMDSLSFPAEPGKRYALEFERSQYAEAGPNDFYVIKADMLRYSTPRELETMQGQNDDILNAESLPEGAHLYIVGTLVPAYDMDSFVVRTAGYSLLELGCKAMRSGSGLQGFKVMVTDAAGKVLQEETELPQADLLWAQIPAASGPALAITEEVGQLFLRVTAAGQSPELLSAYYECGLHLK